MSVMASWFVIGGVFVVFLIFVLLLDVSLPASFWVGPSDQETPYRVGHTPMEPEEPTFPPTTLKTPAVKGFKKEERAVWRFPDSDKVA